MAELPNISTLLASIQTQVAEVTELMRIHALAHSYMADTLMWDESIGRLRVWEGDIKAKEQGQFSVEYRLRDSSHICQQIIQLLTDLQRLVEDAKALLIDEINLGEHGVVFRSPVELEDGPVEEFHELQEGFVSIVGCLFQMSMLARTPSQHDADMAPLEEESMENFGMEKTQIIRRHPKVAKFLVNRLEATIKQRHLLWRHRKRSREDRETGDDDNNNKKIAEQNIFATTEKPFECPYCFFVISFDNFSSQSDHIWSDLLPYFCPVFDCKIPNTLYESRELWSKHVRENHGYDGLKNTADVVECPLCTTGIATHSFEGHLTCEMKEICILTLPNEVPEHKIYASLLNDLFS
ncbi:MAG: hypothetical protein LQ351_006494 [Letrouitia transgressa]|nr:MAG: hypothetical protein LQ351_006494 [Letrouitia transgressa]